MLYKFIEVSYTNMHKQCVTFFLVHTYRCKIVILKNSLGIINTKFGIGFIYLEEKKRVERV